MSASRAVKCTVCPWIDNRACGRGILIDPCPQCGSKVWYETLWYGDCPARLLLKETLVNGA
jgi:hypothetical protein